MKVFIIFTLFTLSFSLFATSQYPDLLVYKGKQYNMHSNPLESYFKRYPKKRPQNNIRSSALWRGYVATFEIKNKKLILKDLKIMDGHTKWKSVKNEFITNNIPILLKVSKKKDISLTSTGSADHSNHKDKKKKTVKEDFVIDWFTGILVLPYGKLVNYVHMGYGSTYENYILLEIQKGVLTKRKDLKAKEYELFKEVQFSEFKKTENYKEISSKMLKQGREQKFIDDFLRTYVISYTSKFLDKK